MYHPEGWNPGVEVTRTQVHLSEKTFLRVRWKGCQMVGPLFGRDVTLGLLLLDWESWQ